MRIVPHSCIFIAMLSVLAACARAPDAVAPPAAAPQVISPMLNSAAGVQTVRFFQSSFVFGGKTFVYKMVGSDPFTAPAAVTIPTVIIPVQLRFADGAVFDPGAVVRSLALSPFFHTGRYTAGTLQYSDALMRSEFWKLVATKNYHVLLATPIVERAFALSVPSADGFVQSANGSRTAILTSQYFLNQVEPQLLATYHISPSQLAIFAVADMRVLEPSGHCCFNGFHSSFTTASSTGTATRTTVWGLVSSSTPTDMSHVSHEIAEWLNDPFYPSHPNIVPSWIHPFANVCDGNQLEVGDPLVTVHFTVNGFTVQDEAFLSWFSHAVPSIGIDGRYDLLGRLLKPASLC